MKLTKYLDLHPQNFVAFNKSSFPNRKNVENSIEDRFFKNPFAKDGLKNCAFVVDENKQIQGQFLLMPTKFYFKSKTYSGNFGFDFILNEALRGKGMGKMLAAEVMNQPNYCVIGVSEASEALHFKFGNEQLATAQRYIRFLNVFSILDLVIKKKNFDRSAVVYPLNIDGKTIKITKINDPAMLPDTPFWNENHLEWDRSSLFLQWRFFTGDNKYSFYRSQNSGFYFVVRKVRWKNLNVLLLVDFRYKNADEFDVIYSSALQIAKKLSCTAVITVTSLESEKKSLIKKFNKSFGAPIQIMSTNSDITKVKEVAVTFADSDIDPFYGDSTW